MTSSRLKYLITSLTVAVAVMFLLEVTCSIILGSIYTREFDSSLIEPNKFGSSDGLKNSVEGLVWGKAFRTDQFGGRQNEGTYNSCKGKTRLYIGDSVTEGVGIDDSSTFVSLVSKAIPTENIINYSLIGYSCYDYLNVLKSAVVLDSSISSVALVFTLNDIYGNAKSIDLPIMAKANWIGKANTFLQVRWATYKLIKLFVYQNSDAYFRYDASFYQPNNPHFKETIEVLAECDSICASHNIDFKIVALPYRSQLSSINREPQDLLRKYCKKANITFIDATDFLLKQSNFSSLYLFADEIHFSEKGHSTIAEFLLHN